MGRWAGPRPPTGGTGGCWIVRVPEDGCNVDLQAPMKTLLCKNKEEGGSARAWPVTAPMPKSDPFSEKRENV